MNVPRSTTEKAQPVGFESEPGLSLKLSLLRWKLHRKAKQEPAFRFYALYDRLYRRDVLETAYRLAKKNDGSPGVDQVSFTDIESCPGGSAGLIDLLQEELRNKSYKPSPVRRTYIEKENGKQRPLGIPCIRDRVVQTAAKLVLEPIFEADFFDCSHGFRPKRSTHGAIRDIQSNLRAGRMAVYDADLSSYFDTIEHGLLLGMIQERISDRSVLKLIRMWLSCPVYEEDKAPAPKTRWERKLAAKQAKGAKKAKEKGKLTTPTRGTPQGGVISPLLANIFLNGLDRSFHCDPSSPLRFANARLIRYADDFVVLARYIGSGITDWVEAQVEGQLKLSINRDKTTIIDLRQEGASLDFLGFTLRYDKDLHGRPGRRYLNTFPSKKAVMKHREKLRGFTRSGYKRTLSDTIAKVNQANRGWKGYFELGYPRQCFRGMDHFVLGRFKSFINHRSQRRCRPLRDGESLYAGLRRMGYEPL